MKYTLIIAILLTSTLTSCGPQNYLRNKSVQETDILSPQYTKELITGEQKAPNVEQAKRELDTQLGKWFYGHGFGRSLLNVGTIVVFPPWALYLSGNAGIELAGYEPLRITSIFPDKPRDGILDLYDGITSVPGRLNATVANKTFVDSPTAMERDERKTQNRHSSQARTFSSKRFSRTTY